MKPAPATSIRSTPGIGPSLARMSWAIWRGLALIFLPELEGEGEGQVAHLRLGRIVEIDVGGLEGIGVLQPLVNKFAEGSLWFSAYWSGILYRKRGRPRQGGCGSGAC